MGTIADKLVYLDGTKTALRDAINAAGGNIGTPDTFRSYAGGWLRDQSATLSLDFANQQYVAKDLTTKFPDRVGFSNIVTFTRASTGTYFDATGVLQVAAVNQPRFDYDPVTGEPLGILIEEQRTNLLRQSDDFSNAAWIKASGVVIAADDVVAPNGSIAQRIDLVGAGHNIQQAVTALSVGMTYTLSVWVRPKTTPFPFQLSYYDGVTTLNAAQFTPEAGKWTRLSYTFTPTTLASSPVIRLIGYGNGNVGDSFYIWGAQLEAGRLPTSYIPTVASQVTRAADAASVNTLSPWYNPAEGKFEVSARGIVGQPLLTAGSAVITADSAAYKDYSLPYTTDPAASSLVIGKGYTRSIKYFPRSDA